ncbi:MAG TPA: hypothetical protein VFO27_00130, partial [Bryobacteraceae bacterium]|nr:hypothetical protein [Bryobacteraceae bacterium]
ASLLSPAAAGSGTLNTTSNSGLPTLPEPAKAQTEAPPPNSPQFCNTIPSEADIAGAPLSVR